MEEIKTLLEYAIQTNTLTKTEVKSEPIKIKPIKTEPKKTITNKSEATTDVIINNDYQPQLCPLSLDDTRDTQQIDEPKITYEKQLLAVTIANELWSE